MLLSHKAKEMDGIRSDDFKLLVTLSFDGDVEILQVLLLLAKYRLYSFSIFYKSL